MKILAWIKSLFKRDLDRCHICGGKDEEMNICTHCHEPTCDGCMADFVSGGCIYCE